MPTALVTAALCAVARIGSAQPFIGANFTASTFDDSGFLPPDTMGAAGVDHVVELINGRYAVFRKTDGVRVQTSTLNTFWANGGITVTSFAFDPRVIYDPYTRRWFACAVDGAGAANSFLVAISNSSDPTAGWKAFKIDSDSDNSHSADFPMMGINGNSVVVSANMFPIGPGAVRNNLLVIPKSDLLLPAPTVANAVSFQDNGQLDGSTTRYPALDVDNTNSLLPVMTSIVPVGQVERYRAGITGGAATFNTEASSYSVGFMTGAAPADQPGPKADLHVGDTRFGSLPVRNGTDIWAVAAIASNGRAAIRWFRLGNGAATVLEQGTIDHPELALMYPSIAVNDFGDVVIGFSGTGPGAGQFASTYFVAGKTSGGTTTFGSVTQTHAGAADYERLDGIGRNRWGDYSATTVDPADPGIFWTVQQFAAAPNPNGDQWADRVSEIIVPQANEVRWKLPSNGIFSEGSSWFGGAAPTSNSHVIFSRSTLPLPGGYNVTLLSNQTVDRLSVRQGFVTLVGQTITATNPDINQPSLSVGEFGGSPTLLMIGGTFNGTNASIAPSSLSMGGLVLSSCLLNLSGTLRIGGAGVVTVASGPGSLIRTGALDLASGAKIDLSDRDMIVDYTGSSPIDSIRGLIQQGYNGGVWSGAGITSSRAATSPSGGEGGKTALGYGEASNVGITSFHGFSIDATTVLVKYTYAGDADLNGQVDVADLGRLASAWQSIGVWTSGDFDYNGSIDVNDLGMLATNWQVGVGNPLNPSFSDAMESLGLGDVSIPEPGIVGAMIVPVVLTRRRRSFEPSTARGQGERSFEG
jgi:hypothetical protein